jgi:hypothetical protein
VRVVLKFFFTISSTIHSTGHRVDNWRKEKHYRYTNNGFMYCIDLQFYYITYANDHDGRRFRGQTFPYISTLTSYDNLFWIHVGAHDIINKMETTE